MPRERTVRQPAGPGRRRTRTPRSAPSATETPPAAAASGVGILGAGRALAGRLPRPRFKDIGFTRRALLLLGVLGLLALPYANSLRIMANQQRELDVATAQIAERTAQVSDLEAQLQRWRDPAHVMSEARTQLGWVLPGETGYRVIGLDGRVVLDTGDSSGLSTESPEDRTRWWDRLSESVKTADAPPGKG